MSVWWNPSDAEISEAGALLMNYMTCRRAFIVAAVEWFEKAEASEHPDDELRFIGDAIEEELKKRQEARRGGRHG
ncbi:hypothetical protein HH303_18325 [Rhodospirillaceae bacterium KN72]|uniref:Uncharacterized protein n=1 Tax=Pacificispira spongiicola TaxID=2729598 RepID=A0A7Y0E3D8_9PROT|nr:hypothetical protein [Pacificispira spongiicola]NMM46453.1 hypothetical protein [Pacificispira spongiicola]